MASSSNLSDSDSDSDSDLDGDGYHEITKEEEKEYYRAYRESEGFDVPAFYKVFAFGLILPMTEVQISYKHEHLRLLSEEAIKDYNLKNGTNFEFVNIVKANHQAARGLLYYITFQVKPMGTPPDFPTTIFQARVLAGIPSHVIEVELCRPKPSSSSN